MYVVEIAGQRVANRAKPITWTPGETRHLQMAKRASAITQNRPMVIT